MDNQDYTIEQSKNFRSGSTDNYDTKNDKTYNLAPPPPINYNFPMSYEGIGWNVNSVNGSDPYISKPPGFSPLNTNNNNLVRSDLPFYPYQQPMDPFHQFSAFAPNNAKRPQNFENLNGGMNMSQQANTHQSPLPMAPMLPNSHLGLNNFYQQQQIMPGGGINMHQYPVGGNMSMMLASPPQQQQAHQPQADQKSPRSFVQPQPMTQPPQLQQQTALPPTQNMMFSSSQPHMMHHQPQQLAFQQSSQTRNAPYHPINSHRNVPGGVSHNTNHSNHNKSSGGNGQNSNGRGGNNFVVHNMGDRDNSNNHNNTSNSNNSSHNFSGNRSGDKTNTQSNTQTTNHTNNQPSSQSSTQPGTQTTNQMSSPTRPSAGSDAQGRAINKMVLDIVKERNIDTQRLDTVLDCYLSRMDCVNMATLLFHTGKKRVLLSPANVKRIAQRLNDVRFELRAREASNALYGIRCLSSDIPEVRELIQALATKIAASSSEFVAQAVGNALYGCQMMTSDCEEVRTLLSTLAVKVAGCTELLGAQNVGNAMYGMRGMNSDVKEVRAVIAALTPKIASVREDFNGQALGNSLYGLQSMSCKEPEVRCLLAVLATKVGRTWEDLKAQELGNSIYGLKRMHSDTPEVRILVGALVSKVSSSPEVLDTQAIGNSFYGLQNMRSDNPEVLALLAVMANKVAKSCPELDGQAMGNSLYGLQGMCSDHAEVRAVVGALTAKIQASTLDMNAQELGNALYGMQNMSTEYVEVRRLLAAVTLKVGSCGYELTSQEIGNAMFGLQNMSSSVWETRSLVRLLAFKISQSHFVVDPQGVANCMFGLQHMSADGEDVKLLVNALASKIEQSWKLLSGHHLSTALFGLQGFCSAEKEVRYLIKAMVPKSMSCRDDMSPKQLSNAIFGLQSCSSDDPEVLAIVTTLTEKVMLGTGQWTLQHLSMALFGMQGLSSDAEEVARLLHALANKSLTITDKDAQAVDGSSLLANAFYGLQRMSTKNVDVVRIVSVLSTALTNFTAQKTNRNQRLSGKVCGSIVYGLQGCGMASEAVRSVLKLVCDNVQAITESFNPTLRNNHHPPHETPSDQFNDVLALYQGLALSLSVLPDLNADADLQLRLFTQLTALEICVDSRQNADFVPRPQTVAEKRLGVELADRLVLEPYTVSQGVLVHGFELGTLVKLNHNIQLKTVAGTKWAPAVNIEVQGSSWGYPAKRLFCELRNMYLHKEKGIAVETVAAESFRSEGGGLRFHHTVLNSLYPPTQEDANNFADKLFSLHLTGPMGLLSTVNLADDSRNRTVSKLSSASSVTSSNSSSGLIKSHNSINKNRSGDAVEYFDDDFRRPSSSPFFEKQSRDVPHRRRPLGMLLGWLGDWPSHDSASAHQTSHSVASGVTASSTALIVRKSVSSSELSNMGLSGEHALPSATGMYNSLSNFGAAPENQQHSSSVYQQHSASPGSMLFARDRLSSNTSALSTGSSLTPPSTARGTPINTAPRSLHDQLVSSQQQHSSFGESLSGGMSHGGADAQMTFAMSSFVEQDTTSSLFSEDVVGSHQLSGTIDFAVNPTSSSPQQTYEFSLAASVTASAPPQFSKGGFDLTALNIADHPAFSGISPQLHSSMSDISMNTMKTLSPVPTFRVAHSTSSGRTPQAAFMRKEHSLKSTNSSPDLFAEDDEVTVTIGSGDTHDSEADASGSDSDGVDAEIAQLEAQLEIARLEARIKALKAKKKSGKAHGSTRAAATNATHKLHTLSLPETKGHDALAQTLGSTTTDEGTASTVSHLSSEL